MFKRIPSFTEAKHDLSDSNEERNEDEGDKKEIKKTSKKPKGAKNVNNLASFNSNYKESSSDSESENIGRVRHFIVVKNNFFCRKNEIFSQLEQTKYTVK